MATEKQKAANRMNAQKCTGPRTEKGKATSSQNALKTGIDAKSPIIRTESRDEYQILIAEYYARFHPTVPEERCLVDDLISAEWLSRRYRTAATIMWERNFAHSPDTDLGAIFSNKSENMCRAQRCLNSSQRNFATALKQLLALKDSYPREIPAESESPTEHPPAPLPLIVPKVPDPLPAATDNEPLNQKLDSFRTPENAAIFYPAPNARPHAEKNPPCRPPIG